LKSNKLSELKLRFSQCAELTERLQKSGTAVQARWERILKPLLLQHFTGTLNFRVELSLANHINKNFTDFPDIDWARVAVNQEFAGHTAMSLRALYLGTLKNLTVRHLKLHNGDVTLGHVAEHCRLVYGEGKARMNFRKEERQHKVIDFFQAKVEELGIWVFI